MAKIKQLSFPCPQSGLIYWRTYEVAEISAKQCYTWTHKSSENDIHKKELVYEGEEVDCGIGISFDNIWEYEYDIYSGGYNLTVNSELVSDAEAEYNKHWKSFKTVSHRFDCSDCCLKGNENYSIIGRNHELGEQIGSNNWS